MSKIYISSDEKDEWYTPVNAIEPLIKFLPNNKKDILIWECANTPDDDSNISQILRKNGYKVITTSIHNGEDFLKIETPKGVTHIITNPPYSIKDEFIAKCYERKLPFALLMPMAALEGKTRFEMYNKNGISLLTFNKRIKFINKNKEVMKSPPFSSCWFCYEILPKQICFEEIK